MADHQRRARVEEKFVRPVHVVLENRAAGQVLTAVHEAVLCVVHEVEVEILHNIDDDDRGDDQHQEALCGRQVKKVVDEPHIAVAQDGSRVHRDLNDREKERSADGLQPCAGYHHEQQDHDQPPLML